VAIQAEMTKSIRKRAVNIFFMSPPWIIGLYLNRSSVTVEK
jgi:hypothetical protein